MSTQAQVAPRFQQAESDVFGRAHTGWEGLAKQAALLDQLGEQVGDLQQKVENLTGHRISGVRVFQVEPPVFLNVEAFILDLPAYTPSLVGRLNDLLVLEGEIGDPAEACGLALPLWIRLVFHTLQDTHRVLLLLRVHVRDVVDPAAQAWRVLPCGPVRKVR